MTNIVIFIIGCVQTLQSKALSPRICDGIIDCPDLADEKNCAYCRDGYMHCGVGRTCIPHVKRCDGKIDCPNGSDEKDCRELTSEIVRFDRCFWELIKSNLFPFDSVISAKCKSC